MSNATPSSSLYDFSAQTLDGRTVSLRNYSGKIILIVNVASFCGFTPQYEGLQALYEKFKDKGFEVLAFPCNQFGEQEPGDAKSIQEFCSTRFHITFPLFSKVEVNGPNAHPLYKFLRSQKKGLLGTESIKWNFTKFLIDRSGNVVERYAPTTTPVELENKILPLL